MLIPEPKYTPCKPSLPIPTTSQQSNTHPAKEAYQPLETIPAPTDDGSVKHATHLNSQR